MPERCKIYAAVLLCGGGALYGALYAYKLFCQGLKIIESKMTDRVKFELLKKFLHRMRRCVSITSSQEISILHPEKTFQICLNLSFYLMNLKLIFPKFLKLCEPFLKPSRQKING